MLQLHSNEYLQGLLLVAESYFKFRYTCHNTSIPSFREIPNKILQIIGGKSMGTPVETWTQVVMNPLVRVDLVYTTRDFFCLLKIRAARLNPQDLSIWRVGQDSCNCRLQFSTLVFRFFATM
jgi:hypothetical protein